MAGVLVTAPAAALGCPNTADPNDCDGDGIPNAQDPCPGIAGDPGTLKSGFRNVACYLPLLYDFGAQKQGPFDARCTPVAARPITESVPLDALRPKSHPGSVSVSGVVFVGVRTPGKDNPWDLLNPAKPDVVAQGFADGNVPRTALFACVGSLEWDGQSLNKNPQNAYGYKLAMGYARALLEANAAAPAGARDALGLFRTVRLDSPKWRAGIAGSNGTLWDTSRWSSDPSILDAATAVPGNDLPQHISEAYDRACYASSQKELADKLKQTIGGKQLSAEAVWTPNPHWAYPPDVDGYDDYRDWTSPFQTKDKFLASADGVVSLARASAFGTRPIAMSNLPALSGPTAKKPGKPAPPPPGKGKFIGDPNQFFESGIVPLIDVGGTFPPSPCKPGNLSTDSGACICPVDALVFTSKSGIGAVYDAAAPYATWDDFIQDGTPSPRPSYRGMDDFAAEVGGDKLFAWETASGSYYKGNDPNFAPRWNLRAPLPAASEGYPPGKQFDIPPSIASSFNSPYAVGVFLATPATKAEDWLILTGTDYASLAALNGTKRQVAKVWTWTTGSGGTHKAFSVSFLGFGSGLKKWTGKTWEESSSVDVPSRVDYAEIAIPAAQVSTSATFDFMSPANAGGIFAAKHLTEDVWYPGADRWLTNFGNAKDYAALDRTPTVGAMDIFTKVQGNPANASILEWEPPAFSKDSAANQQIKVYEKRVETCKLDNYTPYSPDSHWPLLAERTSVAGIYGQVYPSRENVPNAHLASSDLMHRGSNSIGNTYLHEGMDINWSYHRDYIDSAYRGILGEQVKEYCYGQLPLLDALGESEGSSYQVPISCSDSRIKKCGGLADDGCNPAEQIWEEVKSGCSVSKYLECLDTDTCGYLKNVCSKVYLGWLCETACDVAACTAALGPAITECTATAAKAAWDLLLSYAVGPGCFMLYGAACFNYEGQFTLYKKPGGVGEIEVELEHRLAYTKTDAKGRCGSDFFGVCNWDSYPQWNSVYRSSPPPFDPSNESGAFFSTVQNLSAAGSWNVEKYGDGTGGAAIVNDPGRIHPFVLAPGVMAGRAAVFQRMLTRFGQVGSTTLPFDPEKEAVALLPDPYRLDLLATATLDQKVDTGFRLEFLGDAILDCGHQPLHTEIHPPTNIVFHASVPGMIEAKRYSVFAWNRRAGQSQAVSFDLWPPPRTPGKTKPTSSFISPTAGAQLAPGLSCQPFPTVLPNRIRCALAPVGVGEQSSLCDDNPRMLPSCAQAVGGGLIQVGWQ